MSLGAIGAFLIVLVAVFVFGNLWFHLVEWVLGRIKGLFTRRKDPPAWHPLPPEEQDDDL
ncbi:MAG: hypothetical protein Q3X94_06895 [Oscillospiraceae bacterium]|nr:hypothetical protein [Oscillospiraceae bacterium]